MYYQGISVRNIECGFKMLGIDVDHSSIYDWIAKYSKMVTKYLDKIVPRTNDLTMAKTDEIWTKITRNQNYLFTSMDDDIRY